MKVVIKLLSILHLFFKKKRVQYSQLWPSELLLSQNGIFRF